MIVTFKIIIILIFYLLVVISLFFLFKSDYFILVLFVNWAVNKLFLMN